MSSRTEQHRPIVAVYVSHNEIGHALVRSQVLPYLEGLRACGVDAWLVTYERGAPRFPEGEFPRSRWRPLQARGGSSLAAKTMDIFLGIQHVTRLMLTLRADFLHARSYVPAAIAAVAGTLTGRPFIFDMRGFLGEEYAEGGRWTTTDLRYLALRRAERWLLHAAREIVVLTQAAEHRLRTERHYAQVVGAKPVTVVPCVVDLERFRPGEGRDARPTLVYAGALGLRNLLDEMLVVFSKLRRLVPNARFRILNRDDHVAVRAALDRHGLGEADVELHAAEYDEMPRLLGSAHVGILLQRLGQSKTGASAVKVAEYLACGLPVVLNAGHGDVEELVRSYGAGHIVASYRNGDLDAAAAAVARLMGDQRARQSARRLAEEHYALDLGIRRYAGIYERLTGRPLHTASEGFDA